MSKQTEEFDHRFEHLAGEAQRGEELLDDRRALLKKLGRLGLYTAPALILTFESAKAAIPFSQTV